MSAAPEEGDSVQPPAEGVGRGQRRFRKRFIFALVRMIAMRLSRILMIATMRIIIKLSVMVVTNDSSSGGILRMAILGKLGQKSL